MAKQSQKYKDNNTEFTCNEQIYPNIKIKKKGDRNSP